MPMLDAQIGAVLHEGCVGVREWLSELEPGVLERSRTFFANIARDGLQQALKQARAIRTRSSLTEETNARTQEERS
jgi:hypothetical protein